MTIKGVLFDLYGTLFDVHSVADACERRFPTLGREISAMWRRKQLEYTWLRSLVDQFADFEAVTEDALIYTCEHFRLSLSGTARSSLCDEYLRLKAFPEVADALEALSEQRLPLAILSNGSRRSIDAVVGNAGLRMRFSQLISVDEVRTFKPDSRVYALAERRLELRRSDILFVSSNAWDAAAASHYGYRVCWVNRGDGTLDRFGYRPHHTVSGIDGVSELISSLAGDPGR